MQTAQVHELPFDSHHALLVLVGLETPTPSLRMSKRQLLSHFPSKTRAAQFLDVTRAAIDQWDEDEIPLRHSIAFHLRMNRVTQRIAAPGNR